MEDQLHIQSADALQLELPIAGLGSRSYAFIIDWHIRLVLALGWFFLIYAIYAGLLAPGAEDFFFNDAWRDLAVWPAVILYFLYHPIFEIMMKGRTPGKPPGSIRIKNKMRNQMGFRPKKAPSPPHTPATMPSCLSNRLYC